MQGHLRAGGKETGSSPVSPANNLLNVKIMDEEMKLATEAACELKQTVNELREKYRPQRGENDPTLQVVVRIALSDGSTVKARFEL